MDNEVELLFGGGASEAQTKCGRVDLLRDGKGVYGVGVLDYDGDRRWDPLVIRPDRVHESNGYWYCALQPVPHSKFCRTVEGNLVDFLHRRMCERHGITDNSGIWRSWHDMPDPVKARKTYHGLKHMSLAIVNRQIREALEVADQDALRAARRFPIRYRRDLYAAFCVYGQRATQLTESFPFLAVALFTDNLWFWLDGLENYLDKKKRIDEMRHAHIARVLRGEKLRRISDSLGVPYVLRRLTPRATKYVHSIKTLSGEILKRIPRTTAAQRIFFRAVRVAKDFGPDFVAWAARQTSTMRRDAELGELIDIGDWVKASGSPDDRLIDDALRNLPEHVRQLLLERSPRLIQNGAEFVTRRFSPDMSLRTVRRLSADWHEAVASHMPEGAFAKFPAPWIDGSEFDNHKITPITDSRQLYLAAKTLHNCGSSYVDRIKYGDSFLYTVTNGDSRPIVMVEIVRTGNAVRLNQIRATCNAPAPKDIERGVRRWFNTNKGKAKFPEPPTETGSPSGAPLAYDDDLPF